MVTICRKQRSKCNDFLFYRNVTSQWSIVLREFSLPFLNSNLVTNQLNPLIDAAKSIVR